MARPLNPHRPAKLTESQVRHILANPHGLQAWRLAEQFGVHIRTIENVRHFRTWVNV